MKHKKCLIIFSTVIAVLSVLITVNPNKVKAATFIRTNVPAKYRGTWYVKRISDGKLATYKISKSQINLTCLSAKKNTKTYKYTNKAHSTILKDPMKYQLIDKSKNYLLVTIPTGQSIGLLTSNKNKVMYVSYGQGIESYYKSKTAAKKNYKRDITRAYMKKINKLFQD